MREESNKNEIATIDTLRARLEIKEEKQPYGSFKGAYLKTMNACTSPFADYNKNLNSYMENPQLFQLKKSLSKAKGIIQKILKINQDTLKISKLDKKLKQVKKMKEIINENLNNTKKITTKEKNETYQLLNALQVVEEWLIDQRTLLNIKPEEEMDKEPIEEQAEKFINNFEKTFEKFTSET